MRLLGYAGAIVVCAFGLIVPDLTADVPRTINYQGRLTDDGGDPLTGDYWMTFAIYDDDEGGSQLWFSNPRTMIRVEDGLFSYQLGSNYPLPDNIFTDTSRWLEIVVVSETISPRTQLITVPYSYHALRADSADYTAAVGSNSVGSSQIINSSITDSDILDEPGIVRAENLTVLVATSDNTNVTSATITVPASGYVVARGIAYCELGGTQIGTVKFYIATSSDADETANEWTQFGSNNVTSGGEYRRGSLATERVFSVSAGLYTYYLNANRGQYTGGTAYVVNAKLLLTYFPTAYGSISMKSVSSDDGTPDAGK